MRIPRPFINELLTRCDLVELIDARVPLRKKGNNYSACCPFHNEKTPSFTVSATKQFYHCFGCGVSGNAISFLMDYDRLSFIEAIESLAKQLGMTIPREAGLPMSAAVNPDLYSLMSQATHYYEQQLRVYKPAIDYLKQRGLSGQIAKQFGIGYATSLWDGILKKLGTTPAFIQQLITVGLIIKKENNYYDRFRNRIMFPIRDKRGRIIGFGGRVLDKTEPKYLNSPETPIFHKSHELYGLYEAYQMQRNLSRLLVVEGYMDVVALAQYGIMYAVATLGTATTADHIKNLFRASEEIIFCFDGDKAGQNAARRALEITLPLLQDGWQLRFLLLPEGEDPDSLVRKEGAEPFVQRINKAISCTDFLFQQLLQQVDLSVAEGKARLVKLAAPFLNKITAPVLQHIAFERLANLVRMDINTLRDFMQTPHSEMLVSPLQKSQSNKRLSPMRLAMILLLQTPQLAQGITDLASLKALQLPGSELLVELIQLLRQMPDSNTGMVLEHWRERSEYRLLTQLASIETDIPEGGVTSEFTAILMRLQQLDRENRIEQLLARAKQTELTAIEKQQLKEWIAEGRV